MEKTIFNQAKSENIWVEASLVKVPTIANNLCSLKNSIKNNETGLLCNNMNDWYISLKNLINNQELRKYIGAMHIMFVYENIIPYIKEKK